MGILHTLLMEEKNGRTILENYLAGSTKAINPAILLSGLYNKNMYRASLVAQWLRICLPMQGTRVRALVWEDPTCRGATRPVSHNY